MICDILALVYNKSYLFIEIFHVGGIIYMPDWLFKKIFIIILYKKILKNKSITKNSVPCINIIFALEIC